jgi:Ti-type conjugative transfer relaxase TraA
VAIYHFSAKVIGRSSGRSAVAAAAYRSASALLDEREARTHDFSDKADVVHSEILLPDGAPERWADRAVLWNEVEAVEKRKDAQLAREVEFALPRELSREEGVALARDFVAEQFVSRGMVADLNVHWPMDAQGEAKPHAHVMLTMREVGPEGFGLKVSAWNRVAELQGWREAWATRANERLAELGHEVRIDHRSFKDQGVELEPQNKIGPAGMRREERGEAAERAAEHRAIAQRNGQRIAADPELALNALMHQRSTFTRQDLARFVDRHTDGAEQFTRVLAKVEASAELVRLGEDGRGRERFTTRAMLATEAQMERAAERLSEAHGHSVSASAQDTALRDRELGGEQRAAFVHVTGERDLALVVGYAGTGKSTMLGAAREAWEAQGYTVRGAALSGIAAESLEGGSDIPSRTLASLEHAWGQSRDQLSGRDVLVIDEAGLVGSRQMERVLSHAAEAGAKVVLVGDPEQLQAIEAGAAFRALFDRHGAAEITQVRRQHQAWQREATKELATERTAVALERYERAGMVHGHATKDEAKAALVAGWDAVRRFEPERSQVMLAYTRADVRELNELARAKVRAFGVLGADRTVTTEQGERVFAAGDRVMFLRNERSMGVKNGTLGTLERLEGSSLTVRLDGDDQRAVRFDLKDYAHVDHGYAATIHKAQGVTVDHAHVLASTHLDRHAAYVGLTRHREGVELHWAREDLRDRAGLDRVLSRERAKDTTLDYQAGFAERRGITLRSEILVERATAPTREGLRRGMFAGLKLSDRGYRRPAEARERAGEGRSPFAGLRLGREAQPSPGATEPAHVRLERAAETYARAWADAQRMRTAGLPVLPHQEQALARAGAGLDRLRPHGSQDLRVALTVRPELAQDTDRITAALNRLAAEREARERPEPEGTAARLVTAMEREKEQRQDPAVRAERTLARWTALEKAYEDGDWKERTRAKTEMKALARELKRNPETEAVLKSRAKELGIEAGSRLEQVLEAKNERQAMRLERSLTLGR